LIKKIYFKIKRKSLSFLIHNFSSLYRPSSDPYISGDTFRKLADHIFDETKKLNPRKVKENDLIFVKTDMIENFFINIDPFIKSKYLLITHNSDKEIGEYESKFYNQNIIFWFAQNLQTPNTNKISVLPIGLENLRYQMNGVLGDFETKAPFDKKSKVLLSFNIENNLNERAKIYELFKQNDFVVYKTLSNHKAYIETLKQFKFNLCPFGNGSDTHRIWESLMVETIPVMRRSQFSMNLESLNMPLLIVDNWEQLNNYSEEDLSKFYNHESNHKNFDQLLKLDHWKNLIDIKKDSK
tara:strand:- start:2394 stop:3281 length:888 start_codon:yes stop_codon:yes gene_type:complete